MIIYKQLCDKKDFMCVKIMKNWFCGYDDLDAQPDNTTKDLKMMLDDQHQWCEKLERVENS